MFENVGGKIKTFAKVITWVGIVSSVICGIALIFTSFIAGLLVAVIGAVLSWVSALTLYGFGELVENSDICTNLAIKADGQESRTSSELPAWASSSSSSSSSSSGWTCTCGAKNPSSIDYCLACRRSKSDAVTPKKICPHCGAGNRPTNTLCFACDKPLDEGK